VGHGNHPALIGTSDINPGETFGSTLEAIPGAVKGPHDPLTEQLGPVAQGVEEWATGRDRFGKAFPSGQQVSGPLGDVVKRFTPLSYANILASSKKGGGTFLQGPKAFALSELGIPYSQLRDPKTTAALGMKDWETSLSKPDEIQFRLQQSQKELPTQLQLYKKTTGQALDPNVVGQIKGDLEAKAQMDSWQYKFAQSKGANSFRTLPAIDRLNAGLQFMQQHHYITPQDAAQVKAALPQLTSETEVDKLAAKVWATHKIGSLVTKWNAYVKKMQPTPIAPSR
jgi:hypothetical protein